MLLPNDWNDDAIKTLVEVRHPGFTLSEQFRSKYKKFDTTEPPYFKSALAYREELKGLSPAALASLLNDELARKEAIQPYAQPEAAADYAYWATMAYWSIDEAVALSFGKSPKVANPVAFVGNEGLPFVVEYNARKQIFERAREMNLLFPKTFPTIFVAWAKRVNFSLPAELVDAVAHVGAQVVDWKALYEKLAAELRAERDARLADLTSHKERVDRLGAGQSRLIAGHEAVTKGQNELIETLQTTIAASESTIAELRADLQSLNEKSSPERPLHARERDSLLKMVIGMAIAGYGFDPKANRSTTATEIANDLAFRGIALDADTVRKFLTEGKDLLPPSMETEQKP